MIVVFATKPLKSLLETLAREQFPDNPEPYYSATMQLKRMLQFLLGNYPPCYGIENDDPYLDTLEELLDDFLVQLGYAFSRLDVIAANPDVLNFYLVLEIADGYPRKSEY